MVDPLYGASNAQAAVDQLLAATNAKRTSSATTGRDSVGKEAFLTLLVTQLRNQDPTNPLEPHEFAAQLAQFTSVEQLTTLNAGVETLAQQGQLNTLMGETAFSASLVGKTIVAQGDQVEVPVTGAARVRLDVGTGGGEATITLKDKNGRVVAERPLGRLPAGQQNVDLPSDLPVGSYTYEIQCTGPNGSKVPVRTFVSGRVEGVHFTNGVITLRVGALDIPLSNLSEIGQP